ncbi:IS66 family element, transposase [Leptospira santarosai str. HAI134]|uniref:IS66 family transposase n=8 Tax=Leptospira santarosai TaxID=28183 RepID=UPI0002BE1639|nr:IS66 family transposase [Leptospira santarosai]EMO21290.1 IS66 family element, transposase [Leptospira santarosai str. HAI134]MDI7201606.1 IS66 family transposase [Leptospira santarosai]
MSLDPNSLPNDVEELKKLIILEKNKILEYEEELRLQRLKEAEHLDQIERLKIQLFGRKTEKWSQIEKDQGILFNEIESSLREDSPEPEEESLFTPVKSHTRKKTGRKPFPDYFPRIEMLHDIADSEKICSCGHTLSRIGEEKSEKLDIIPAKVQVEVHVRPKYACKHCEGTSDETFPVVRIAPVPNQIAEKSMLSSGFLAYTITQKFADALPFYRQVGILQRSGVEISRTTLSNTAIQVFEKLSPMMEDVRRELFKSKYLQIDETTLQVLNEEGKLNTSKSYMWVIRGFIREKPVVLYHYEPSRSAKFLEEWIQGFEGIIQTDGFQSYDSLLEAKSKILHAGCWNHARRKFFEILKIDSKNAQAQWIVREISKLYAIESKAKEANLNSEEHLKLRQSESKPIVEEIRSWMNKRMMEVAPKSSMGKAIGYLSSQWEKLQIFLKYPELKLDTNLVENDIRPFVVGRKNWLFSGAPQGATASAGFYSLIQNAKVSGIDPYAFLRELFKSWENHPRDLSCEDLPQIREPVLR